MLKSFGMLLIIIISAAIGNYYAISLNKRTELLKAVGYMLEEIEVLLRFKSATVYEIINSLNSDTRFNRLIFINLASEQCQTSSKPFSEIWLSAVNEMEYTCLKKEDKELISSIGINLGTSDLEGQISSVKLKKSELSGLIKSSENEYLKKAKLYRSLGVLTGAFVSILII